MPYTWGLLCLYKDSSTQYERMCLFCEIWDRVRKNQLIFEPPPPPSPCSVSAFHCLRHFLVHFALAKMLVQLSIMSLKCLMQIQNVLIHLYFYIFLDVQSWRDEDEKNDASSGLSWFRGHRWVSNSNNNGFRTHDFYSGNFRSKGSIPFPFPIL